MKNNVTLANYFMSDGLTQIPNGYCWSGDVWSPKTDGCMSYMFAETTLELPTSLQEGDVVIRWRWHGSTDTDGKILVDAASERSLFINCKDVIIGSPEVCASRATLQV